MNAICFLVVQSGGGGVVTCMVVVEQQAAAAVVWTACTPSLEDLGQAGVDVSLVVDCLLLMERNRGHMTGFGSENRDRPFVGASRSLEFYRWALTWEKPD